MKESIKGCYIEGAWITPEKLSWAEVTCPSTEKVIAKVAVAGETEVDAAVRAAARAFPEWSRTSPKARATLMRKLADELDKRQDEMLSCIANEVGMPKFLAKFVQVAGPIATLRAYANLAENYEFSEKSAHSLISKEPVGVAACLTPWNFPFHQATLKIGPALAAGCTVVHKPSIQTPLNALLLAEAVEAAGIPPGVYNLVIGAGTSVGEMLATHPLVNLVSFTGSTTAGRRVMALAADKIKRVSLELGGKSPSLILPDADLAAAVRQTVKSCTFNSGQTCSALTRMLVPADQYELAVEMAVAEADGVGLVDPVSDARGIGPLISRSHRERVLDFLAKGLAEGASIATGGPEAPTGQDSGWYLRPTVLTGVSSQMTVAQEEIFGPVLTIIPYRTVAEAIAIANDTVYGLAAAVWAADEASAMEVAAQINAGQININGAPFNAEAPFGGFKMSGLGREGGKWGMEEYLEYKAIQRPIR